MQDINIKSISQTKVNCSATQSNPKANLIIVSGRSGSGKSIALHYLEDHGFYCVDNLPLSMLPKLLDKKNTYQHGLACSIDVRNWSTKTIPEDILKAIQACQGQIWFLDAEDNVLMQRFVANHRQHPLFHQTGDLSLALQHERTMLTFWSEAATEFFDTTHLNERQLHQQLHLALMPTDPHKIPLTLISFGYKFGLPQQASWIVDLRHLPNPYWECHLRNSTGLDTDVQKFFNQDPTVTNWLAELFDCLGKFVIPSHHGNHLVIGMGCTGGQHRSVYGVAQLANWFLQRQHNVFIYHRELRRLTEKAGR